MPISKKDRIAREHKKADAAGTRAPVKANGLPVKAAKEKVVCKFCRKEMVKENRLQLEAHVDTHADAWTFDKCFPDA
jgi:hypothetical protein